MMAGLSIVKKGFVPLLATLLLVTSFGVQPVKAEGDAAAPSTYYVASGGDDSNPGTEALPWKTVTKAAETLVAGDTVYIKEGTYNERVMPQNSGSPGKYITYTAYSGDVKIDGTGINVPSGWGDGLFSVEGKSYIKVLGLGVMNSSNTGYLVRSSDHIIIENCYASGCQASGIFVREGTDIVIDSNEITNVCKAATQEGITLSGVDGFEVKNNHVHDNPYQEGIDAKDGCRNGKIYGNHVHGVPSACIYVDAYYEDSFSIDVFKNKVHDSGVGISLGTEMGGTLTDIRVYNNIIYDCTDVSMAINREEAEGSHLKKNVTIVNNTLAGTPPSNTHIYIPEYPDRFDNFVIRNNILSGATLYFPDVENADAHIDHNLFTGWSGVYGTDYQTGDPKFVDPAAADFHLEANSPAIDTGSSIDAPSSDFDGDSRPQGAGHDIGAYEVGNVDVTPPVITAVAASNITTSSAIITWSTDESATSQVEYGTTEDLGLFTSLDTDLVTNHNVSLSGLDSLTTYYYKVKSRDTAGNLATSSNHSFTTEAAPAPNNPPNTPSAPSPANHATGIPIDVGLSWSGGDPDAGDAATYDVYFGTGATPALVSNDQTGTSYDPGTLSYDTKYYWKIVARDNHGAVTEGDVWDFITASAPPSTDTMWAESITFTPTGSELQIKVKVVNPEPVRRAWVRLNLKRNGRTIWNGYGITNSAGEATCRWRRAIDGEYLATITYVKHRQYTWDESQGVTSASYTLRSTQAVEETCDIVCETPTSETTNSV